jgi:DNA-directed RNA polymerase specialized sigma24 family protein
MSRQPHYGELQAAKHPEAYAIWHTRHVEPDSLPPEPVVGWDEFDDECIYSREVLEKIESCLSRREWAILVRLHVLGATLEEIAAHLDLTRERVRQIANKARSKCIKAIAKLDS